MKPLLTKAGDRDGKTGDWATQHNSSEVTGQNSASSDEVSAGMSSTPLDLILKSKHDSARSK